MTNIKQCKEGGGGASQAKPKIGLRGLQNFQSISTSFCLHIDPSDSMRSEVLQNHVYSALSKFSDIPSAPLRPPQGKSYSEYCGQPCEVEIIVGLPLTVFARQGKTEGSTFRGRWT